MARKLVVIIELGTDAFNPSECVESARILRVLASKLSQQKDFNKDDYFMLADMNGNTVGGADVKGQSYL